VQYAFKPVEKCDMCGSGNFRLLGQRLNRSQGFRPKQASGISVSVKQCRDCDLIFSDPQPIPENLSDHYDLPPEEYWKGLPAWSQDYFAREIETAKRLLDFRPGMTALDIGAGVGLAMQSLSAAGFDTWGLEPAEPFYEHIVRSVDPSRIALTTLEDASYGEASFDFITFGAVLEHLYDPAAALESALRWLKPNGLIQAEVPSSDYLVARLVNLFFRLRGTSYVTHLSPMHPPFHLFEFGLESFRKNGLLAGYSIAEHHYDVCTIPHFPKLLHAPLRWWMDRKKSGMQLTVYLRRLAD